MPEAGYLPIPLKLARQGVKDMVRISDARMSGTAYGTVVPLSAHHSWPVGTNRLVTVKGKVIEFDWANPHPMMWKFRILSSSMLPDNSGKVLL